jgi:hypothetical protein
MNPREPMPLRAIRVPTKTWEAAKQKADERGDNLSEVIRAGLERYIKSK